MSRKESKTDIFKLHSRLWLLSRIYDCGHVVDSEENYLWLILGNFYDSMTISGCLIARIDLMSPGWVLSHCCAFGWILNLRLKIRGACFNQVVRAFSCFSCGKDCSKHTNFTKILRSTNLRSQHSSIGKQHFWNLLYLRFSPHLPKNQPNWNVDSELVGSNLSLLGRSRKDATCSPS